MSNATVMKAVVVSPINVVTNQEPVQLALVNPDGTTASTIKKQSAQADSVAASTAAVVTDFNALLAKLRLAGVIA